MGPREVVQKAADAAANDAVQAVVDPGIDGDREFLLHRVPIRVEIRLTVADAMVEPGDAERKSWVTGPSPVMTQKERAKSSHDTMRADEVRLRHKKSGRSPVVIQ
jgi:hypothetical protein